MLSNALARLSQSVRTPALTYVDSVALICTYVAGVKKMPVPQPDDRFPQTQLFGPIYDKAQQVADDWTLQIMAELQQLPISLSNGFKTLQTTMDSLVEPLSQLAVNPDNIALGFEIANIFNRLQSALTGEIVQIQTLHDRLVQFNASLPNVAGGISYVANGILLEAGLQQAQVDQLKQAIAATHHAIDTATGNIIEGAGRVIGTLLVGLVGSLLLGPEVGVLMISGFIVTAGSTYAVLNGVQLVKLEAELKQLTADLSVAQKAVLPYLALAGSYDALSGRSLAMESQVGQVLAAWTQLTTTLQTLESEFRIMKTDSASDPIKVLISERIEAQFMINGAAAELQQLFFSLVGTDAPITIGMTSTEIQAAIVTEPTVAFSNYIMQGPVTGA